MKKVFSTHAEIANEFINGNFEGFGLLDCKRSRNASTDGRAFWSYSTCIACKYGEFIAVDSYRYSKTTDKQKSEIIDIAEDRFLVVEIPQIHHLAAPENIEYLTAHIKAADAKLRRARSTWSRLHWSAIRSKFINYLGYMPALLRAAGYTESQAAAAVINWREIVK